MPPRHWLTTLGTRGGTPISKPNDGAPVHVALRRSTEGVRNGCGIPKIAAYLFRLRDSKFTEEFCSILETDGIEFRPIPPRSPNLNPFSETWVGRTKAECLNWFIVFGEAHLRHILKSWLTYYHQFRPHQGLGNVPIDTALPPPAPINDFHLDDVVCHESLGGLLRHFERRAA